MTYAKLIFVVMASLFYSLAYGLPSVTNAELSAEAEQRSLIIEFSSKAKYTVFSLANPDRLVIDLEKIDKRSVKRIFSTKNLISGISGFRIGTPFPGTTRLVLDLNESVTHIHTSEQSARNGKERVRVRWEMPASIATDNKPNIRSSSIAEASAPALPEIKKPPVGTQENIEISTNDNAKPDVQKKFKMAMSGAEQGDASAMYMLGMMYANGQGVPQDYKKAALWYYKASERGNALAQYRLGVMYANGDGVTQSYEDAVAWYRKAAKQGNAMAQFNLGAKYASGQGVPQDYKEAASWYSRAADQGLANAQNNLGVLYFNGQGVPRNLILAYKWVSLANAAGDWMAANNKKVAEANMTPKQIEEAQTLVRDWLASRGADTSQAQGQNANSSPAPAPQAEATNGNTALVRIDRFQVKGNTLLETGLIERLLNPFKGNNRSYTDIQRALEALEGAYRSAGYSAVHVVTPEQDITDGTVTFQVMETVVGKVTLNGNQHYDKTNIRNALPALAEGYTPSARTLSENLRLANENPTRQMDVVFSQGEEENNVNAEINVHDSSPHKVFATLDNTGSPSTGMYRAGIGYQNNNLFNRDQAATFNYVTSPGHVSDVKQLSGSYRIPLYSLGDSLDMIAAHSDANAGTSPIVGGLLTFSGNGNVYGAHYNHLIPRQGDYTSKIIAGLDYRSYFNNCLINGAPNCGSSGNDLTVHPFSLTYGGTLTKPAFVADYSTSVVHNIPGGVHGATSDFIAARPDSANPLIGAPASYTLIRFNGSLTGVLPQDWQYRVAENLQYTRDPLVSYEDIGLVGANAVRGFLEREVFNDKGAVLNFELYTPELSQKLNIENGSFRLLGFIDRGQGSSVQLPGEPIVRNTVGSAGLGFRYNYGKNITTKFDLAKVTNPGDSSRKAGDIRGQIGVMVNW
jgi:hemolysin activation/secretion protein